VFGDRLVELSELLVEVQCEVLNRVQHGLVVGGGNSGDLADSGIGEGCQSSKGVGKGSRCVRF